MNEADNNPGDHHRHRPVHQPVLEPGHRSIIVFLTICTKDRRPLLANHQTHATLRRAWTLADHWLVGRYVIMPDHLHLFCGPGIFPTRSLINWVRYWKATVSKVAGAGEGTFWQANFWDTQLRQRESYAGKWDYVRNNPVRAGLRTSPDAWPYQGEQNVLRWHD
jgi:REP element-mobilizing transposase RayT